MSYFVYQLEIKLYFSNVKIFLLLAVIFLDLEHMPDLYAVH